MRWLLALVALSASAEPKFRVEEIAKDFGIGYAVQIADMNGDGKPDVLAINETRVVWYENPGWQPHVILDGGTARDNVAIAAHDIDGDGKLDVAVGASWQPTNTLSGGTLQWIRRDPGDAAASWRLTAIGEEPTLHRIRWGDVDGDGKSELVVMPLHGRGNVRPNWEGDGVRVLVYRPPKDPAKQEWPYEVADNTLHIVHNFIVEPMDGVKGAEIVTASREGVHVLKRGSDDQWKRTKIGEGSPGEIKLGRFGGKRHLATVEPWHGNSIVIYHEQSGLWAREVIEDKLAGAHALGWADFDGDGNQELAVGWREKGEHPYGIAIYTPAAGKWKKTDVDEGGMATEDLAVGDLNGDGKPDIVASGRATKNVRIYWNESRGRQD
jgi:hypothetical protein